jgi:hypothetical protein
MHTKEHLNASAMALYDIIRDRGWHDRISVGVGKQELYLYFHEEVPQCYLYNMEMFRGILIVHRTNVGRVQACEEAA